MSDSLWPHGLVALQTPPPWNSPGKGYWSGLPSPAPGDFPDPGITPRSPALQADSLPSEPPEKGLKETGCNWIERSSFGHLEVLSKQWASLSLATFKYRLDGGGQPCLTVNREIPSYSTVSGICLVNGRKSPSNYFTLVLQARNAHLRTCLGCGGISCFFI